MRGYALASKGVANYAGGGIIDIRDRDTLYMLYAIVCCKVFRMPFVHGAGEEKKYVANKPHISKGREQNNGAALEEKSTRTHTVPQFDKS